MTWWCHHHNNNTIKETPPTTVYIVNNSLGGGRGAVGPEDEARRGGVGAGLDVRGEGGGARGSHTAAALGSRWVPVTAGAAAAGAGGSRLEDERLCVLVLELKHQVRLRSLVPLWERWIFF